jgi:hypothetical protein
MYRYKDSNSDMDQESFVLSVLKEQRDGYYVELGSGDPFDGNNTSLLESGFGWKGVAFDIDQELVDSYNSNRKNPCIKADALTFDYEAYFKENNFPKVIDYLQIDIDGHESGNCMLALLALPMLKYRFKVITIEHDLCVDFKREGMRNAQREILHSLGYTLIGQMDPEDWWVDMSQMPLGPREQLSGHMRHPNIRGEK